MDFEINGCLLPSPPLSERRRYCDARRLGVCVCVSAEPRLHAALVSAAKVMRCISVIFYLPCLFICVYYFVNSFICSFSVD